MALDYDLWSLVSSCSHHSGHRNAAWVGVGVDVAPSCCGARACKLAENSRAISGVARLRVGHGLIPGLLRQTAAAGGSHGGDAVPGNHTYSVRCSATSFFFRVASAVIVAAGLLCLDERALVGATCSERDVNPRNRLYIDPRQKACVPCSHTQLPQNRSSSSFYR
jgi:hypothetical protein